MDLLSAANTQQREVQFNWRFIEQRPKRMWMQTNDLWELLSVAVQTAFKMIRLDCSLLRPITVRSVRRKSANP